jgi:glutamate N-acetyltransferase/amino-acid N-acetyltransferase
MEKEAEFIQEGTVTSPKGFHAGAVSVGIKDKVKGKLDLGILFSEAPCVTAAVFTRNRIKAAPVVWSRERVQDGRAVAVVVNSGCANACTGEQGLKDAAEMASLTAEKVGISSDDVLVASTGVIGQELPMELIRSGINEIVLAADGGHLLAKAMMTTDTVPKEVAVRIGNSGCLIGGATKGSGMIHPDLATMLCFLTTDVAVDLEYLKSALRKAVDISFNMISVDGDSSTNDTVLIMANGLAGNSPITKDSSQAIAFQQALNQACVFLAKSMARDGEGATKLIEVNVSGATSVTDARLAARTIVSSSLVKTAVYGNDPNWGRIIAAVGRSGAEVVESKNDLYLGDICVLKEGRPVPFNKNSAIEILKKSEVVIDLNLNLGEAQATAWGCDLTEEYIIANSKYTT